MGKFTTALKKLERERAAEQERREMRQEQGQGPGEKKREEIVPVQTGQKLNLEQRLRRRAYLKTVDDSGIAPSVVAYHQPFSLISEQYRMLRTNISRLVNGTTRTPNVFVLSSAFRREGKSITAVNLAITFAQDFEKNVLLVDCDLRGGKIRQLLALGQESYGLSDVLSNGLPTESAIYKTRIDRLAIIPRGKIVHNPSELLGSKRMKRLLQELKPKFDYIILDSSPIIPVTDAALLASHTDGVIFVVQAQKTHRHNVAHAEVLFKQAGAKILGFVLTKTDNYIPAYVHKFFQKDHHYPRAIKNMEEQ